VERNRAQAIKVGLFVRVFLRPIVGSFILGGGENRLGWTVTI
jgi:hypothetical protein